MMGVGLKSWGKDILEKSRLVQKGKNKKSLNRKIFNISHTSKVPWKLISWTLRIIKMANSNFFSDTSHNGDSHGGISLTCNISF